MLNLALSNIEAREKEFSELDAVCGDGDHGTAIVAAMKAVNAEAQKGTEFKTMLTDMAFRSMTEASGSTSTLIGSFFLGMSNTAEGESLSAPQIAKMFQSGLDEVRQQTKAQVGDKTIMDALVPAVEAIGEKKDAPIREQFEKGAEAAKAGAVHTASLKANFGRARNLGERSIGSQDPGATSWACLFESFYQALN